MHHIANDDCSWIGELFSLPGLICISLLVDDAQLVDIYLPLLGIDFNIVDAQGLRVVDILFQSFWYNQASSAIKPLYALLGPSDYPIAI